jgi:NADH-quinone oxidoreductase subunit E
MSVVKESILLEVVRRYEADPGMLIPMMQDLQAEYGYLPPQELKALAAELGVPLSRVYGVAMFYSSFRLSPRGLHEVTLCMGTVCYLKGAPKISEAICAEYGIKPGGTTSDRLFTLQAVNCVGACALAPVMVVDGKYYDGVTADSALQVLRDLADAQAGPPQSAAAEAVSPEPAAPAEAPRVDLPVEEAPAIRTEPETARLAPEPAPEPAPKARSAPKTKPAARPKAQAKPAVTAKPKARSAPKAKPAARPKAQAKPAAIAKPKAKPRDRKGSRP